MTDDAHRPLSGGRAQVFELLQHVIAIGKHRGTFSKRDVFEVVNEYLTPTTYKRTLVETKRELQKARDRERSWRQRCEYLEAELRRRPRSRRAA